MEPSLLLTDNHDPSHSDSYLLPFHHRQVIKLDDCSREGVS
jgi:hypothetical protein